MSFQSVELVPRAASKACCFHASEYSSVDSTDGPVCISSAVALEPLEGRVETSPVTPSGRTIGGVRLRVAWSSDRRRFLVASLKASLTTATAEISSGRLSSCDVATSRAESVCGAAALCKPSRPCEDDSLVVGCARPGLHIGPSPLTKSFVLVVRFTWVSGVPGADSGTTATAPPFLRNIFWSCVNLQGVS
jgi:hypothetical protein